MFIAHSDDSLLLSGTIKENLKLIQLSGELMLMKIEAEIEEFKFPPNYCFSGKLYERC